MPSIRVIRLCGLDLEVAIVTFDDSAIAQTERLLDLSPQQRIERHQRIARQLAAARRTPDGP